MAAYSFVTGQDIFNAIMQMAGQTQSLTDKYALDAQLAIMQEYKSVLASHQWFFAKSSTPGIVTTFASLNPTVTSISGSTVTLSATIANSMQWNKFYMNANFSYYRITAHTAGTATLTLDASYVETQTSGAATIYQDEFNLASNCLVPWTPMRIRGQWERDIEVISEKEGRARYGWSTTTAISVPEAAWIVRTDPGGTQDVRIQIAPWPTAAINIEYDYTVVPTDLTFDGVAATDTPLIPVNYRWILFQRAVSQLYATKNDDLSERAWKRSELGIGEMAERYLAIASENRFFSRPRHALGVG